MPRLTAEFKKQIRALTTSDLEKIVTKWAGRDKNFYEYLFVTYINPDFGEQDLFEQYKDALDHHNQKTFPGRSEAVRLVKMMKASIKSINEFRKSVKSPHFEAELYLHLLDHQFDRANQHLGSYYKTYDNTLARLVKKAIDLIVNKLHEDYLLEYRGRVNGYLLTLHRLIPYNSIVREMPRQIG